ncbi:MAG: hypothetical protein ABIO44_12075, partial [Saprospiraceae bacterium]
MNLLKKCLKNFIQWPLCIIGIPVYLALAILSKFQRNKLKKPKLVWGPVPLISNKYWSRSLEKADYFSRSFVETVYAINRKSDFDIIFYDFIPESKSALLEEVLIILRPYLVLPTILWKFDIVHIPFSGGVMYRTILLRVEYFLYYLSGIKVIVIPYGRDFYQYSRIADNELKHALLLSYPELALQESLVRSNIRFWSKYADCIVGSFHLDGLGRWDVLPYVPFMIELDNWRPKESEHSRDGIHDEVRIIHTPNHKGFKGTEFILNTIE